MALNWQTIQDALYDVFAGAAIAGLTIEWVPSPTTQPTPAKPYVTLNLREIDNAQGAVSGTMDELAGTADPDVYQFVHHRRHKLSVNVFSNATQLDASAFAILAKLNRHLQKSSPQAALLAAGIRMWQTSPVRDLSAMLDTRGEGRAQCDYTLATLDTTADEIGYIATADVTTTVEAP